MDRPLGPRAVGALSAESGTEHPRALPQAGREHGLSLWTGTIREVRRLAEVTQLVDTTESQDRALAVFHGLCTFQPHCPQRACTVVPQNSAGTDTGG